MTKESNNPIEFYISKQDTLHEGTRNNGVYKAGCRLRWKFGLEDEELRRYLHIVNMTLCRPPLDENEVDKIAASVDRSHTPLGTQTTEGTIDTDSFPQSVDEILSKEISLFSSATDNTPIATITIKQFLDDIKNGKYQEQCEEVQAEPDKEKRQGLKKKLPCVTIQSIPCERRKREFCTNSAIVCIDIDGVDYIDETRCALAALPYVFAVIISVSGRGVFALAALSESTENLEQVLNAMQQDIPYSIDMSGKDVSRLRYVSYDPDLILKDSVVPFRVKQKTIQPKIDIDILDTFIEQVKEIPFSTTGRKIRLSDYYITSIANLLATAKEINFDIGIQNETPHVFNGQYWQRIEERTFRHFLQAVGIQQGIPHEIVKDYKFVKNLVEQFISEARFPIQSTTDTAKINLLNGTLHFRSSVIELKPFDKQDGLTYQLPYGYAPSATAPIFKRFFDRVLPDESVQKMVFQYIAYIFLQNLTLDKVLFLHGGGANGKSVFLNVIRALIGSEQCCSFSLEDITKSPYHRAELGNFLLNVSTEISTRMKTDIFKILACREPLEARHPYGRPFTVTDYATSIFAMNTMPNDVEQTDAFFRRFIIVPFNVRISVTEQDPELAKKIISNEMSGVLNLVIEGAQSLLATRKFDIPEVVQNAVEEFRRDSDSVSAFINENEYFPSDSEYVLLEDLYVQYKNQYFDGLDYRAFSKRLRGLGFTVKPKGRDNLRVVYVTRAESSEETKIIAVQEERRLNDEYVIYENVQ